MIIVRLNGGLGNQMFQYALGLSLSIRLETELVVDRSSLDLDPLRSYQLDYFSIYMRTASDDEKSRIIPSGNLINQIKIHVKLMTQRKKPIVTVNEKSLHYDPQVLLTPNNSYMVGYWQSEKYFSEISHFIKSVFNFPTLLSSKNASCLKRIEEGMSVSVHIRHGDYLTNPIANSYHGVCSLDYYHNAMKIIEKSIKEPEYFIFTDDPEWARINIITSKPKVIIDWNSNSPQEDLRLMSSCKHHIIANSSFSWWGAWLGNNKKKIVIAPEPWLDTKKSDMQDIYGNNWIRVAKNN